MRIYKYELNITDDQWVRMPENAQILTVQIQDGKPHIWALVDTEAPSQDRYFRTIGTGHYIEPGFKMTYLGTYQLPGLVFHVFYE